MPVQASLDQKDLVDLLAALKALEDGSRREFVKEMRGLGTVLQRRQRVKVLSARSSAVHGRGGLSGGGARAARRKPRSYKTEKSARRAFERAASLRRSIAAGVGVKTATGKRTAGVNVILRSRQMPEGQKRLPRLTNRGTWRHPVFGNPEVWVQQDFAPEGWFSETARDSQPEFERGMVRVMTKYVIRTFERGNS